MLIASLWGALLLKHLVGYAIHHTESQKIGLGICLCTPYIKHWWDIYQFQIWKVDFDGFLLAIVRVLLSQVVHPLHTDFALDAIRVLFDPITQLNRVWGLLDLSFTAVVFKLLILLMASWLKLFLQLVNPINEPVVFHLAIECFFAGDSVSRIKHSFQTLHLFVNWWGSLWKCIAQFKPIYKKLSYYVSIVQSHISFKYFNLHIPYRVLQIRLYAPVYLLGDYALVSLLLTVCTVLNLPKSRLQLSLKVLYAWAFVLSIYKAQKTVGIEEVVYVVAIQIVVHCKVVGQSALSLWDEKHPNIQLASVYHKLWSLSSQLSSYFLIILVLLLHFICLDV